MKVSAKWIWLQLGALVLFLVALIPLWATNGAVWSIALLVSLFILYIICLFLGQNRLRCPACGAPLYGLNGRYLLEHERETYCAKCGTRISIE